MRIVIDLQGAQTQSRFRGIGRYSLSLAEAVVRNNHEHEILLILNSAFPEAISFIQNVFKGLLPESNILIFDVPKLISWESPNDEWKRNAAELIRENFIADLKPDVVLTSSLFEGANQCNAVTSIGRLKFPVIQSVILYDLIPLQNQKTYLGTDWIRSWYFNKLDYLKRADLLFSISEYTASEAKDLLDFSTKNIVNISASHTKNFIPAELDLNTKNDLMSRLGIRKPYLMYNGAFEARKNLEGLMQAFSILPDEFRDSMQLVFAGTVSEVDLLMLQNLANSLGIQDALLLTGYVADEDLITLFSLCEVFVFPSTYEGFGLPALEAMACGAPTIGSNLTSIPEVIGREDALFDPHNPKDIASKILRVLTDADFNSSLRAHALTWSSTFSWDRCAKRLLKSFENVMASRESISNKEWPNLITESQLRYRKLIDAIGKIDTKIIKPTDTELIEVASCIANNNDLALQFNRQHILPEKINWRVEGPFDSSYSLALVNRECARALKQLGHNIILHSSEGPGDFDPNPSFLKDNFDLNEMYKKSLDPARSSSDVTSRNMYPPRVIDMNDRLNFLHAYAWEETGFPTEWVDDFNSYLQGITVVSAHVEKLLVDAGVKVPIAISGNGVDHWLRVKSDKNFEVNAKSFRFLHVSSCFPRKGVDVMLRAYGMAFRKADDVTLIIKTFSNPHNKIKKWLTEARDGNPDFPDVLVIEEDLADSQLKALYEKCDVLVAPSRAEGFGLPLAEAMLSDISVITTAWSGQLDFCNEETSWLVDYKFALAKTHFDFFDSVWAEPDIDNLASVMKVVFQTPLAIRKKRSVAGKKLLLEKFRWVDVAERLVNFTRTCAKAQITKKPRIGWVTSWNTRCGIAAYSEHLIENITNEITIFAAKTEDLVQEDRSNIQRCWDIGEIDNLHGLANCLNESQIDTLVIQFNYGFFNFENFSHFLNEQVDSGRVVVLMMHSTSDPIRSIPQKRLAKLQIALALCHRILVHTLNDLNRLKDLGLVDNVTLFPHGIIDCSCPQNSDSQSKVSLTNEIFTIATYGFFLPHKGFLETIEAMALLRQAGKNVRLRMVNSAYPVPESSELINLAKEKILATDLNEHIELMTDFVSNEKSLALLADADLILFPYQNTGESSSAAVRYGLATGRPVAVTPLSIFDDVAPAVYKLSGQTPDEISLGIIQLIHEITNETELVVSKRKEAARWCEAHRYNRLGSRLDSLLHALANKNCSK